VIAFQRWPFRNGASKQGRHGC